MKKIFAYSATAFIILSGISAHAEGAHRHKDSAPAIANGYSFIDHLSGSSTFTSNYVYRGVSQTQDLPAVQGSLTYTLPLGFYLNLWGSNVKFNAVPDATLEIDTIGGIRGKFNEDTSFDLNVARYNYPRANILNYNEMIGLLTYKILTLGIAYSGNVYNVHKTGMYYNGVINYDVPTNYTFNVENISLGAGYGHASLPRAAGNSYSDFMLSIAKKVKIYKFMLQWTGTDHRQNLSPVDDYHLIASVTADF